MSTNADIYDTKADLEAATAIQLSGINAVHLCGYNSAGDGGAADYFRMSSAPSHNLYIYNSASMSYWWISGTDLPIEAAGAISATTGFDNAPVFRNAVGYAEAVGGCRFRCQGATYYMSSMVDSGHYPNDIVQINTPGVFFEGVGRDTTSFTYNGTSDTAPSSVFHWYSVHPTKISSGGMEHCAISGGTGTTLPTYALWITSTDSGTWRDLAIMNAATTAWQWDCQDEVSGFGNNNHLAQDIWVDQRAVAAGKCIFLSGNSEWTSDTSLSTFINIRTFIAGTNVGADAFTFDDSDTCVLIGLNVYVASGNSGYGYGLVFNGNTASEKGGARNHLCYGIETAHGGIRAYAGPPQMKVTDATGTVGSAITLTVSDTTGFTMGDPVTVAGILGTVEANGNWVLNTVTPTTLKLTGSTFANAYVPGTGVVVLGAPSGPNYVQMQTSNSGYMNLPQIDPGAILTYATENITRYVGNVAGVFVNAETAGDVVSEGNALNILPNNFPNAVTAWSDANNHLLLLDGLGNQWGINIDSSGNFRVQQIAGSGSILLPSLSSATEIVAGNGSDTFGTEGLIYTTSTTMGTGADTTEDTLATFTLPPNSLDIVNRKLRIRCSFSTANNLDGKRLRLHFGNTSIIDTLSQTTLLENMTGFAEMIVTKTGSSTQIVTATMTWGTSATIATPYFFNYVNTAGTQTDTASITIKFTGQNGSPNANDIVCNDFFVEFMN